MTRVLVTLSEPDALVARLRDAGVDATACPLIRIESLGDDPIDVEPYDWVVVTSAHGARELRRRMTGAPRRVAAIGPATAAAFGGADLVPAVATQEGLLAALPRPAGRVLFAGAEDARRLLVDELGADFVALYRTVPTRPSLPDADLAVLGSGSAARALAELAPALPAVSIGPVTTAAAREAGLTIVAEAPTHDLDGLVEAVDAACSSRS